MATRPRKASATARQPPSEARSWSDLPPELAGLILRQFSSLADRVRFGTVCRHWGHAARLQATVLPPVLPWTISFYNGKVQTIPEGEVHRPCSSDLALCWCSSENWLLMIGRVSHDDTESSRNFLKNPLSGATLSLPRPSNPLHPGDGIYYITKFIVCPGNLVVATIRSSLPPNRAPLIVCCRPGTSTWSTSSQVVAAAAGDGPCRYEDIAFHDRYIYAITQGGDLFVHEVSNGRHVVGMKATVQLSSANLVIKSSDPWCVRRFRMVSRGGSLLMVKWNQTYRICDGDDTSAAFEVFEADLQTSQWSRLSSVADQVLFVSQSCSKAVTVSNHVNDYLCGNRIYFVDSGACGPKKMPCWAC